MSEQEKDDKLLGIEDLDDAFGPRVVGSTVVPEHVRRLVTGQVEQERLEMVKKQEELLKRSIEADMARRVAEEIGQASRDLDEATQHAVTMAAETVAGAKETGHGDGFFVGKQRFESLQQAVKAWRVANQRLLRLCFRYGRFGASEEKKP